MITLETFNLNSIRGRLWVGFGVLVAMLVVAGVVARRSFAGISDTITQSLAEVQSESQLASGLSANIAKTSQPSRVDRQAITLPPALPDMKRAWTDGRIIVQLARGAWQPGVTVVYKSMTTSRIGCAQHTRRFPSAGLSSGSGP